MPGSQVKDWDLYHALREKGYSKEKAARIANAVAGRSISKHASPVHPGTGTSQKPHGSWAHSPGEVDYGPDDYTPPSHSDRSPPKPPSPPPPPKRSILDIVGRGRPHKFKAYYSSYLSTSEASRDTVRRRLNALTKIVQEHTGVDLSHVKIKYYLDYESMVHEVGDTPMARWEGVDPHTGEGLIVVSPSIATGLFDNDLQSYRQVTHELIHAASGPENTVWPGGEQTLEEGMAEIISLQLWAEEFDISGFVHRYSRPRPDGSKDPLWTMVDLSAYNDFTGNLIMHAADEVGFDRQKIGDWLAERWKARDYDQMYQRYELFDAPTPEETIQTRIDDINTRYDELIARLPQHAEEYNVSRQKEIDYVREISGPTWEWESQQRFLRMERAAQEAGIDTNLFPQDQDLIDDTWDITARELKAKHGTQEGLTKEVYAHRTNTNLSLLYWFLGGQ